MTWELQNFFLPMVIFLCKILIFFFPSTKTFILKSSPVSQGFCTWLWKKQNKKKDPLGFLPNLSSSFFSACSWVGELCPVSTRLWSPSSCTGSSPSTSSQQRSDPSQHGSPAVRTRRIYTEQVHVWIYSIVYLFVESGDSLVCRYNIYRHI